MTFETLNDLSKIENWKKAVVVFTKDSWGREYSLESRSYEISHDNRYFQPMANANSLFGNCLDGKDNDVRLDRYMSLLPEEGIRWKVEYCYITEKEVTKLKVGELRSIWNQLDGACEALERLAESEEGKQLLKNHEKGIDFSAIVSLKNDVEEEIQKKGRELYK